MQTEQVERATAGKRNLAAEVGTVFLLTLWPSLWSVSLRMTSSSAVRVADQDLLGDAIFYASQLALVAFLVARSDGGFGRFGFALPRANCWWAFIATAGAAFVATVAILVTFHAFHVYQPAGPFIGAYWNLHIARLLLVSVPMREVWRQAILSGYLLTRLDDLWGSQALAVIVPALLWGCMLLTVSPADAVAALVCGLIFGASRYRFGSAWPAIVAGVIVAVAIRALQLRY